MSGVIPKKVSDRTARCLTVANSSLDGLTPYALKLLSIPGSVLAESKIEIVINALTMIDSRIFRLIHRISPKLNYNWTIAEMAGDVGLSTQHFQKLFKKEIGMPPMVWLQVQRLEKFAELLLTTSSPIKVIGHY